MTSTPYITAPAGEIYWRYEVPAHTDAKVFLLTVGRIAVVGNWYGSFGQAFIAWAPMPKRDKVKEAQLGLLPGPPAAAIVEAAAPGCTGKRELSDREWAAQPADLREGCTVRVPGVGGL